MEKDDVQLIDSILSGDEAAFTTLVKKYQKSVHALVWGKIGDFQIAEEITQDTFLQVHRKLSTLKKPSQFAGWLYVIANRLCTAWLRKQKPKIQSLEATSGITLERYAYGQYLSEQREEAATEYRRELVRRLLEKLPESERTVMILHYLGEMKCEAISRFLGVSVNTIKSRLSRARRRLKTEVPMIRKTFGSVQLPANFTENIAKQIATTKPVPASVGKPLLPWAALSSTVVLLILMLGASDRYLTRFQKPYNLEAQSETAVEVVDAPVVDVLSIFDVRHQVAGAAISSEGPKNNQKGTNAVLFAEAQEDSSTSNKLTQKWTQASGPQGGKVHEIFLTSEGKYYAVSPTGIYQLTADAAQWTLINNTVPTGGMRMPMAEANGILYIVSTDEVYASTDDGVTWHTLGPRPKGQAIGLVITDDVFYFAIKNGIFHSTDVGKQWFPLNDGLNDRTISAITSIGNTVFAGTDRGLFRLSAGAWERLSIDPSNKITSMEVFENNLYVGTKSDYPSKESETYLVKSVELMTGYNYLWGVFYSPDLGDSWIEITPKDRFSKIGLANIKVLAADNTLLVLGNNFGLRSKNGGQTWQVFREAPESYTLSSHPVVAVNENTFYKVKGAGIYRTINGGESWHLFMKGMPGTTRRNLVTYKNQLYSYSNEDILKSTDGGESWNLIHVDSSADTLGNNKRSGTSDIFAHFGQKLAIASDTFFALVPEKSGMRVARLFANENKLMFVEGIPPFTGDINVNVPDDRDEKKENAKDRPLNIREDLSPTPKENVQSLEQLKDQIQSLDEYSRALDDYVNLIEKGEIALGEFVASGENFYLEYKRELFKWEPGSSTWSTTGLMDAGEQRPYGREGFRIAVSDETVYVGKRDGRLFQSLDGGNRWNDVTTNLPVSFNLFNEIIFAGSTIYVGTDNGVLTSDDGEKWVVLTDDNGDRIVMDCLAIASTEVYGVCDAGIYKLDNQGIWELSWQEVPDRVRDLVVSNGRFYIATNRLGMFHIPLKKKDE